MSKNHPATIHRFISRRNFIRMALVIIVLISVATIASMDIALRVSTNYVLEASRTMREDLLNVYQQILSQKLSTITQDINLFTLDADISRYISSSSTETDFTMLRTILQKIVSELDIDPIVDSIYIFDQVHNYVLSDSYQKKDSFNDSIVFSEEFLSTAPLSDVRTINDNECFSYIFQPLTAPSKNMTTIVVNLSVEKISQLLPDPKGLGDFILINSRGNILYTTTTQNDPNSLVHMISESNSDTITTEDGTKYLTTITEPQAFNTQLILLQQYDQATYDKVILRSLVTSSLLAALAALAAIGLLAAFYLYRPLNKTIKRLKDQGYSLKNVGEYDAIDHALTTLTAAHHEAEARYDEIAYIRDQYYLLEFLVSPVMDHKRFDSLLKRFQMVFNQPAFSIIVADLHDRSNSGQRPIPSPVTHVFPENINVIANQIGKDRIAYVLNFPSPACLTPDIVSSLKRSYNEDNWDVCIYCSNVFFSIDEMPLQYSICDKMLEKRFFIGYDALLESDGPEESNVSIINSASNPLLTAVQSCDEELAQQRLDGIISQYANSISNKNAVNLIKFQLMELCFSILSIGHERLSSEQDEALLETFANFIEICESKTLDDIHTVLSQIISATIHYLSERTQLRNRQFVQHAMVYIENNLNKNLSLDEIARAVYLSTNYFCTIFKNETNKTVMDYVIERRIELAKHILITQPTIKISILAEQLGYNSTQSFIRQFKKITHITPDKYRKDASLMDNTNH